MYKQEIFFAAVAKRCMYTINYRDVTIIRRKWKTKKNTEVIEGNARGSRKTMGEIFPVSGNGKHRLINLSVEVWGGERAAEESSDGFGYLVRDDLYFGNDTSRR